MIKIQDGELLDYLPSQLKNDTDMICLSHSIKIGVQRLLEYEKEAMTQIFVDYVPEHILDVLAVELQSPYYEQWMDVDVKRRLIKNTLPWYMKAGTVAAVKELIGAAFGGGDVVEWFQMDEAEARPGEFDVTLGILPTDNTMGSFIGIINAAKNVRSHLRKILVTLSGPLDGPDLMEGRTEKGKYGIDILYFLIYYAEFFLSEIMKLSEIRFHIEMDFWDTHRYNGKYKYDGSIKYRLWRRYGLELGIGYESGRLFNRSHLLAPSIRFLTSWKTPETAKSEKINIYTYMQFWDVAYYDGILKYNGSRKYNSHRWAVGTHIVFSFPIRKKSELIGEAAVLTRSKTQCQYNGRYRYDGAVKYKTINKEEIIA